MGGKIWAHRLIMSAVLLFSAVASVISPGPYLQPARADNPPPLFYRDDFSDLNGGWPVWNSDIGSASYGVGTYYLKIKKPEYFIHATSRKILYAQSFIAEIDVAMETGDKEDYAGLKITWTDKNEAENAGYNVPSDYFFEIFPEDGSAVLYSRRSNMGNPNSYTQFIPGYLLLDKRYSCINSGQGVNRIRLLIDKNHISAFCNGVNLIDVKDDSLDYAMRLIEQGIIHGATISIIAGKYGGSKPATFEFDNLKFYRGNNAAIIAPLFVKGSRLIEDVTKALNDEGFKVQEVEYYSSITGDLAGRIKKVCDGNPVRITIVCDISQNKDTISLLVPGSYSGESIVSDVQFLDFTASDLTSNETSYRPGDMVTLKTEIENTGLTAIDAVPVKFSLNNDKGSCIYTGELKLGAIPEKGNRELKIEIPLPLFTASGRYTVAADIIATAIAGDNLTVRKQVRTDIRVSGQSALLYAVSAVVLISTALIIGLVIFLRKRKGRVKSRS